MRRALSSNRFPDRLLRLCWSVTTWNNDRRNVFWRSAEGFQQPAEGFLGETRCGSFILVTLWLLMSACHKPSAGRWNFSSFESANDCEHKTGKIIVLSRSNSANKPFTFDSPKMQVCGENSAFSFLKDEIIFSNNKLRLPRATVAGHAWQFSVIYYW